MEKTTLYSPTSKIYPPGEKLDIVLDRDPEGKIKFPEKRDRKLFSPIVEAYYSKEKKELLVRAVVFIAREELKKLDFRIYQNCYIDLDGNPQLQFFIAYDLVETEVTDFYVYEVDFTAEPLPNRPDGLSKIKQIETFLWDIDPVSSRGTVTNVQDSN